MFEKLKEDTKKPTKYGSATATEKKNKKFQ